MAKSLRLNLSKRVRRNLRLAYYRFAKIDAIYRICRRYVMAFEGSCDTDRFTNGEFRFLQQTQRIWNKEGSVLIDCGAHVGNWTAEVLDLAKPNEVEIHCFEPSPRNFDRLAQRGFPQNVILNQCALGSHEGNLPLYLHPSPDQDSLYKHCETMREAQINVPVTTIDNYCAEKGIQRVSFMKIDAEGHDFEVLKGMQSTLQSRSIDIIQFEYGYRNVNSKVFLKDIYDYIVHFDYQLYKIRPYSLFKLDFYAHYFDDFRLSNYVLILRGVDLSVTVDQDAGLYHNFTQL